MAEVARLFPALEEPPSDPISRRVVDAVRIVEALLFAATEPMSEADLVQRMPQGVDVAIVLAKLRDDYAHRGIRLVRVEAKWLFRTADDLAWLLTSKGRERKKLSRAALETLAIVAYHQPTTRAEIEDIRGVAISKGTLDVLLETGWVRLRGRRRAPGRPITYGTTPDFLMHFGFETIADLPGLDELRGAGLFDGRLPSNFSVPSPWDGSLHDDEDPLDKEETQAFDDSGEEGDPDDDGPLDRDPFA